MDNSPLIYESRCTSFVAPYNKRIPVRPIRVCGVVVIITVYVGASRIK